MRDRDVNVGEVGARQWPIEHAVVASKKQHDKRTELCLYQEPARAQVPAGAKGMKALSKHGGGAAVLQEEAVDNELFWTVEQARVMVRERKDDLIPAPEGKGTATGGKDGGVALADA